MKGVYMFINSISGCRNSSNFKSGPNPEVLRNKYKILLTQDIWAPKLSVRIPETDVEKEVLLEILQNRAKLDRFTRLTNQRFELRTKRSMAEKLKRTNPQDKSLSGLVKELENYGNIDTVLKTLDKNIDLEVKKNKSAFEYFKNIEKTEDEYLSKHILKPQKMDKFWHQVRKNNINADMKYSTRELIDIISNGKQSGYTAAVGGLKPVQQLSKKEFISRIESQYEQFLRENVDIYSENIYHIQDAKNAQRAIYTKNREGFKRYPEAQKAILKIFDTVQGKYLFKVDRVLGIDIYPIGEIFKDMHVVENDLKGLFNELRIIKSELEAAPDNNKLKEEIANIEKAIEVNKEDWINRLEAVINYESKNRQIFAKAGREADYSYLTDKNKMLNRYKTAYKIFEENKSLTNEELEAAIKS